MFFTKRRTLSRSDPALASSSALSVEFQGRGVEALTQIKETPPAPISSFITPAAAAEIAGIDRGRLYDWARGKKWAHRPTKRCLRIDEKGFRQWLSAR